MKTLFIRGTDDTPEINFDQTSSSLFIRGSSFPENTYNFYEPIFSWLKDFLDNPEFSDLGLHLDLNYYNSSSSKVFMNLFHLLDGYFKSGKRLAVNWYYDPDDEDSLGEGEDFRFGLEVLPFNLLPKIQGS